MKIFTHLTLHFPAILLLVWGCMSDHRKMIDSDLKSDQGFLEGRMMLFDPALRTHKTYGKTFDFLNVKSQDNTAFPKARLKSPTDKVSVGLGSSKQPYHLVVFWASWCAPCRQEIPQLKKLYQKNARQVAITSISIDENEGQWKKALIIEKMPWKQLLVADAPSMALLDKAYDLSAVPVWILLDANGRLIRRRMGYEEGEGGADEQIVELLFLNSEVH